MTWKDPRINVTLLENSPTDYIRFGPDVMKFIWVPDIYIDGIQDLRSPAYKVKCHPMSCMIRYKNMLEYNEDEITNSNWHKLAV